MNSRHGKQAEVQCAVPKHGAGKAGKKIDTIQLYSACIVVLLVHRFVVAGTSLTRARFDGRRNMDVGKVFCFVSACESGNAAVILKNRDTGSCSVHGAHPCFDQNALA